MLWCSSYHVCLTRRRYTVQACTSSRKTFHNIMSLLDYKNHALFISSIQHLIWYYCFEVLNRKCCVLAVITSAKHAEGLQFMSGEHQGNFWQNHVFYLIKITIKHFISSLSNIWYEITARSTNIKVLWCSGYHVCLTRRRFPVQAWTASMQVFDKMMFFTWLKIRSSVLFHVNPTFDMKLLLEAPISRCCGVAVITSA